MDEILLDQYQMSKKDKKQNNLQKYYEKCSHKGPCSLENNCYCIVRGFCEKYCLCDISCKIRFQGCNCNQSCKPQTCKCMYLQRECDPDLCKCPSKINIKTVLKNNMQNTIPYCQNTQCLYQYQPKLFLQKSNICNGLGLFAAEIIPANTLIGEYVGELVGEDEVNLKDIIYSSQNIYFNFDLGIQQQQIIDPFNFGSIVRFINHLSGPYLENSGVKNIFVRHSSTICLYSTQNIFPGQEIFFNYGESYSVDWIQDFNKECDKYNLEQKSKMQYQQQIRNNKKEIIKKYKKQNFDQNFQQFKKKYQKINYNKSQTSKQNQYSDIRDFYLNKPQNISKKIKIEEITENMLQNLNN